MDIGKHTLKWRQLLSTESINSHLYYDDYQSDDEKINKLFVIKNKTIFDVELDSILQLDALRRLENKTQVFAFKGDGKVRTRLTHSIDAMNVGYLLGTKIADILYKKYKTERLKLEKLDKDKNKTLINNLRSNEKAIYYLPLVLRNAALLHDIGNPPFGHRGEALITNWLEKNLDHYHINKKDLKITKSNFIDNSTLPSFGFLLQTKNNLYQDIKMFEGNAELIRLITKLSYFINGGISIGTLSACMKYTADINDEPNENKKYIGHHKLGHYFSEKDIVNTIRNKVGTNNRNPSAFLLEASDDIAYRLHDIDDCIKSGHINLNDFLHFVHKSYLEEKKDLKRIPIGKTNSYKKFLSILCDAFGVKIEKGDRIEEIYQNLKEIIKEMDSPTNTYAYEKIKTYLRLGCIDSVAKVFVDNIDSIMGDNFNESLSELCDYSFVFNASSKIMKQKIYNSYQVRIDEVAEYKIVNVLMENLINSVFNKRSQNDDKTIDKIYGQLEVYSSKRFLYACEQEILNKVGEFSMVEASAENLGFYVYYKLRCVIDNISGMSDDYSLSVYKKMQAVID